jgi:hypothetical protein
MSGSAQRNIQYTHARGAFERNARASFMGSKLIQSIGVATDRLDAVHDAMWLRLIDEDAASPVNESDQLAAQIVAVARTADRACAKGGSQAAMAAVMRESGQSIDPMIAQNFLRLASSPIFWLAMDSVGDSHSN